MLVAGRTRFHGIFTTRAEGSVELAIPLRQRKRAQGAALRQAAGKQPTRQWKKPGNSRAGTK